MFSVSVFPNHVQRTWLDPDQKSDTLQPTPYFIRPSELQNLGGRIQWASK